MQKLTQTVEVNNLNKFLGNAYSRTSQKHPDDTADFSHKNATAANTSVLLNLSTIEKPQN